MIVNTERMHVNVNVRCSQCKHLVWKCVYYYYKNWHGYFIMNDNVMDRVYECSEDTVVAHNSYHLILCTNIKCKIL